MDGRCVLENRFSGRLVDSTGGSAVAGTSRRCRALKTDRSPRSEFLFPGQRGRDRESFRPFLFSRATSCRWRLRCALLSPLGGGSKHLSSTAYIRQRRGSYAHDCRSLEIALRRLFRGHFATSPRKYTSSRKLQDPLPYLLRRVL